MKDWYSKFLYVVLGTVLGNTKLIALSLPWWAILIMVAVLIGISFIAILDTVWHKRDEVYKFFISLTFYLVTVGGLALLWIGYLHWLYTIGIGLLTITVAQLAIMALPLLTGILLVSIVDTIFNRWLSRQKIK